MWGQVVHIGSVITEIWIIPTRVGTRTLCIIKTLLKRDHPHACGDKGLTRRHSVSSLGSSPRVWGQVAVRDDDVVHGGIIPTRVGTSTSDDQKWQGTEDHPHACGDKAMREVTSKPFKGSSPRVWGQAGATSDCGKYLWIIPTRVGTRWIAVINQAVNEDHPHACGDKYRQMAVIRNCGGSSPRVWGQAFYNVVFFGCNRIIPTRVGTSSFCLPFLFPIKDHPHACGDK